jgi:glutamine amidotransferase
MQMLARSSEEGSESGLGWIPGVVRKIRFTDTNARELLPHMGWNTIDPDDQEPLLVGLDPAAGFYFLHSYRFECDNEANAVAHADYGARFACVVREKNVYGVQCHPEKSHHNGIRLLKNFAEL